MKKLLIFTVCVFCFLSIVFIYNNNHTAYYENYKSYWSYYGINYFSIDYKCSEEERSIVQPIIDTAKDVFSHSISETITDKDVGALSRYYCSVDVTRLDLSIELVTAKIRKNSGFMWVIYSDERYDENNETIDADVDILSYWKIKKNDDGNWIVTDIIEAP